MPIHLLYELNKCKDISNAVPLRLKSGGRAPSLPTDRRPCCVELPNSILAKKFAITQIAISYTKCRNPPLLP